MGHLSLEGQIKEAGIYYPRSYDIAYRIGFVIQSAGALGFTILYFLKHPIYLYALILFEAGICLSSVFLLVWKASIKKFILRCFVIGVIFQLMSLSGLPLNDKMFWLGLGFVLAAGGGLTGKEAYCFGYPEGWLLLIAYPVAVLPNLFGFSAYEFNLLMAAAIALLQVSFLRRKLSQPLLKGCEADVCGLPEEPAAPADKEKT